MRSPVLIAETPFAGGHGPRFLAPGGREVDADVASYYIGRVREVENDVEEVEGEDYLAVQRLLTDEASGHSGAEILVLAGIDVDRMSGEERDEVLEQLRERLEVLADAVAAIDWSIQGNSPLVEIPELDEWHEAAWDALPRTGPWADPDAEQEAESAGRTTSPPASEEESHAREAADSLPSSAAAGLEGLGAEDSGAHDHEEASLTPTSSASGGDGRDEGDSGTHDHEAVFSGVDAEDSGRSLREPQDEQPEEQESARSEFTPPTPFTHNPSHPEAVGEESGKIVAQVAALTPSEPEAVGSRKVVAQVGPPTSPEAASEGSKPAPVILEIPLHAGKHEQPTAQGPVTLIVQVLADPKAMQLEEPEPQPDVIVPAREPAPILPAAPIDPPIKLASIDPVQVSASIDRSPALAPIQPATADSTAEPRRGLRWWVWFPWTALALLLAANYLYLSQVDRTWQQRVTEKHHTTGPTRVVMKQVEVETVVEKPVDRVVEKIVEKIVEKPVPVVDPNALKKDQWTKFEFAYQGLIASQDLITAAELLGRWQTHLPAWGKAAPPGLAVLDADYKARIGSLVSAWSSSRARDRRFADAYTGLAAFAAAPSVQALIGAKAKELADKAHADVHAAEDEYHYTQIRTLVDSPLVPKERLTRHINAYLALVEPPGRMLAEVQKLATYRQWQRDGRPTKAVVKIEWGPHVLPREHEVEIALGQGKESQTFTRTIAAEPGRVWTDTFPVKGTASTYRVKTIRGTSPVEELVEAARQRTELFLSDPSGPLTVANENESGTKVTVDWQGVLDKPTLPAWSNTPGLPKVGP